MRWSRARERRRILREEIAGVRGLLAEDLTWVGEELGRLDREVAGLMLDDASRSDHSAAHVSCESAQRALPRARTAAGVGEVADALADAARRVACTRARVAGEAAPDRQMPCFFDVRHGLSSDDVVWTDPVHGSRSVAACARDAAVVAERRTPAVRTVRVGARTLAYWNAGAPAEAYYWGWFGAGVPFLPPVARWRQGVDWRAATLGAEEALKYGEGGPPDSGGAFGRGGSS